MMKYDPSINIQASNKSFTKYVLADVCPILAIIIKKCLYEFYIL